jgi:hypothetical protein
MDLYHLRQGLHVIASSWDYHGGAEGRVSVRGNSVRFNMLPVRQARTLCHQLPREDREQGCLEAQVEERWQVPVEARPQEQVQEQAQGRATIEEEGEPRQGPSDGWSKRHRLQFRVLHLELKQQLR